MKICLLCSHQEKSYHKTAPETPYVCSSCMLALLHMSPEQITEQYKKAIEENRKDLIFALASFVPRKVRDKYPCKVTKRDLGFDSISNETR